MKGVVKIEKEREKGFLTADEVAEMLHVSRRSVWGWIRQGKLKAAKLGRSWLIRESDFEDFVR